MVTGTVSEWAWVSQPMRRDPVDRPFAWAVVALDRGDEVVCAVDSVDSAVMHIGLRVQAADDDASRFVPAA